MVLRSTASNYFQSSNVSWDDVLKAIALIGFLVICFLVILRRGD